MLLLNFDQVLNNHKIGITSVSDSFIKRMRKKKDAGLLHICLAKPTEAEL